MSRLKKIVFWFTGAFLVAILSIIIVYSFYQKAIIDKITTSVNADLPGEVSIEKFNLGLFSDFPYAVIGLQNIKFYEHKTDSFHLKQKPIIAINNLSLYINIFDLFKEKISIRELSLEGGSLNLINYSDSTLNIINALGQSVQDSTDASNSILLNLSNIEISDFRMIYNDRVLDQYTSVTFNTIKTEIQLHGDSLKGNLDLDFQLDSIILNGKKLIRRHTFSLVALFESDLSKLAFSIDEGSFKVDRLETTLQGFYNYSDSGYVDILITANHTDLSELLKMEFLNADNLPDIRAGELSIDAKITGKTIGKLPSFEATAWLRNVQLYNTFGKVIDKAGFNLQLSSGRDDDMRDATLSVDSISIEFASGGFVNGTVEVTNFKTPAFKINWEASEDLEDLYRIIEIPEIKEMKGELKSNGSISGSFSLISNKLLHHHGAAMVAFKNVELVLKQSSYPITNLNGTVYMINGDVGFDEVSFSANGNILSLNGRIQNFVSFIMGKPTQLVASISVQSDQLDTETLLAFDTALAKDIHYKIDELDVSIRAEFSSNSLDSYELIPVGTLDIQNLTIQVEGAPRIADFNGKIEVDETLVSLKDFNGIIGKSQVNFSVSLSNYAEYLQANTTEQMIIDISLKSEQVNAKDFFTFNNKFVLPKNYEEEVLKNVAINAKIITTNTELQKKDLIPELELQLTGLQFQTLYSPVVFKDIFVFALIKDNNVYINSMFGKFGRSDVFMNAQFDNVVATKDTISRPLKSRISFNAGILDLDELIKLDETEAVQEIESNESSPSNPFAEDFPVIDFQVNIGELTYFGAVIRNLKGIIKIEENNKIKMEQVSLESGEFGSFEFDGTLDASSRYEAILKSTIKISNVDLSNLNVKYIQNGEEVKISDHFEGIINGQIVADVPVLPDFSFDLSRLIGKIKIKMTDGALINYAPLEEMGKYFKNKDLNRVRFDELKNVMIFNGGKMLLPFMTINTTLGTINIMGFQTLDYDMIYDIQVPIKLVAGAALNSLFSAKKGDDKKEDKVKKGGKVKYITLHISGSADDYKFKLGKKHVLVAPPGFNVD